MIELIALFALGLFLGYSYRDLRDNVDEIWGRVSDLEKHLPIKKTGVTLGSYHRVDEVNPPAPSPKAKGHVVNPKTPQKMEYDSMRQLEEENIKFRVGPK